MYTENHPIFISEWIYKQVKNKNFDINETLRLVKALKYGLSSKEEIKKSPLSAKSVYEAVYLNSVCATLFQTSFSKIASVSGYSFNQLLSEDIEQDCKSQVKTLLMGEESYDCVAENVPVPTDTLCDTSGHPDDVASQYYELQVTQDGLLVVVVKSGFLNHLVKTKDNYIQFVLKCLELSYNRSPKVTDETTNGLLGVYLYYNTGRHFDALFRAKILAALS